MLKFCQKFQISSFYPFKFEPLLSVQVLEGEGQGILPGHKKTKVVVQMLKEDAGQHEKLTFLQEGLPYKYGQPLF